MKKSIIAVLLAILMLLPLATVADIDRNGQADIMDVTWLQRFEVGLKAPIGIGKPIAI